jgi:hypothetical protein
MIQEAIQALEAAAKEKNKFGVPTAAADALKLIRKSK